MVKAILVNKSCEIFLQCSLIIPVLDMALEVIKHLLNLEVCTTMLRSLQLRNHEL